MEKGSKSIGVVDYGRGNLRSVCKALEAVGASVSLVTEAAQLDRFDAIVVPGVGAFGDCAENLRASGFGSPCANGYRPGGRISGFASVTNCSSNRVRNHQGAKAWDFFRDALSASEETTSRSPTSDGIGCAKRAVPSISPSPWTHTSILCIRIFPSPSTTTSSARAASMEDHSPRASATAACMRTQFHPEKSQSSGLTLLKNFLETLA